MRIACNLLKEGNVITFDDLRSKHSEVVGAQSNLRRELINVATKLKAAFVDSLSMAQSQWKDPTTDELIDYVYMGVEKNGKGEAVHASEMNFDDGMGLPFFIGVTIDKSPISFPKTTMAVTVRIVRDGDFFALNLRNGQFETSIPRDFNCEDLSEVCEVMKQFIIKDLDSYIPAK
jgi:hypothetical protein